MRKLLPVILLILGLGVLTGAFLFVRGRSQKEVVDEETALIDVRLEDRPIAALFPSQDGHWLKLTIEKFKIEAKSLDYELLYKLPDGRTQGVPGTITLKGEEKIERDLLLGSESSGKFKYDEGVEEGTLTLRFRNEKGKLIAKFTTEFHLQTKEKVLTSVDGKFSYKLATTPVGGFFVTMVSFGVPGTPVGQFMEGPYSVFASAKEVSPGHLTFPGEVSLEGGSIFTWSGVDWQEVKGGQAGDIGTFYSASFL